MTNLAEEITKLRESLVNLAAQKNYDFMDTEVLALSCRLDKLIVAYQSSMPKNRSYVKSGILKKAPEKGLTH